MKTSKPVRKLYPIYDGDDDTYRFKLGTVGKKTLIVIGLNPSTATDEEPDLTIKKIMKFAEKDYDSFIMLNLYAQRTTHPAKLHSELDNKLHAKNLKYIFNVIESQKEFSILAAWGGTIKIRDYFINCLHDIHEITSKHEDKWLKIGTDLTKNGKHPRHPSRISYENVFTGFSMKDYIETYPRKRQEMPII